MSKKLERLVTPIGEAKWAHIHQPKAAFDNKGDPKYQIDVVFEADNAEWKQFATDLMTMLKSVPDQFDKRTKQKLPKNQPIKAELDEKDEQTGRWYVTFKTSAKFRPGVFDKFGKPIPDNVMVGNGSKVRVCYSPDVYDGFGGGVCLYLNAVQVLELVEYKAQTAEGYGFTTEAAPAGDDNPFNTASTSDDKEDAPFPFGSK